MFTSCKTRSFRPLTIKTKIFLRGMKDQYVACVCSSKKGSSLRPSQGLAGHSLIRGNVAPTELAAYCKKEIDICTYGFFL